jgi:hypothetical protein
LSGPHRLRSAARAAHPGSEAARLAGLLDKGLIGFDVETGSRIVRPELLRLVNRGTNTTADEQYALAA